MREAEVGVDVSLVTYQPDFDLLQQLLESLAEGAAGAGISLYIHDNSPASDITDRIASMPLLGAGSVFKEVAVNRSATNVGFGRGNNAAAAHGRAPFLLVINQDCVLEPGALAHVLDVASNDDAKVAAWELRQIPYEHPKAYDPVTLETPWVSGAASLFRRIAFESVGGFDSRIFMYGEDVDLSWRLRAAGWRLRYAPRAAVVHRTYRSAGEVKPLQALGGVETNLCLRARYGGLRQMSKGLLMLGAEMLGPQDFPGRRRGLIKALFGFLGRWPHFQATRVRRTETFAPLFSGWGYETRRDGAFVALRSRRERPPRDAPMVSILIRTVGRGEWLRQALETVANQTWPNIEAVIVEDGPPSSGAVVDTFRDRLTVRYRATGDKVGRARAGNLAMSDARGEWLNFLDDDDVFFADHVETLIDAAVDHGVKGVYGLSWETPTKTIDRDRAEYDETEWITRHWQPFDRLTLWQHNYMPIQAVLFHRSLYAKYGGFAEDMDQLEDWNLWTRYTLEDDFRLVEKTTSKYRVPAAAKDAAARQALLDDAYQRAIERQRSMRLSLSPYEISTMADTYARSQAVLMLSRNDARRFVSSRPWLARLFAWRAPVMRRLRRRRTA